MQKSLNVKLARIAANPSCGDFILADAKDADMAFGISAFGRVAESLRDSDEMNWQTNREGATSAKGGAVTGNPRLGETRPREYRSIQEFRDQIREIVAQKLVDIMLMSVSTCDTLAIQEK